MTQARPTVTRQRSEKTDGGYEHASLSTAIVLEIADRSGRAVTDLPVLYDTINPEALDRIAASGDGHPVSISFEYAGHRVDVTGCEFELRPADGDR